MGKDRVSFIETDEPVKPDQEVFATDQTEDYLRGRKAEVKDGVQYNALGLESTADHRHVSKIWQDKCESFPAFAAKIHAEKEGKTDVYRPQSYVRPNDLLKLANGEGFTYHGLLSLVTKYAKIPVAMLEYLYKRGDYADLSKYLNLEMDKCDNAWNKKRERIDERQLLLRLRPDKDGNIVIRMVGSDRYGVVDNHEIIEMLFDGFKTLGIPSSDVDKALASHTWTDGDRMTGNILLPDQMKSFPDSDYGVGIAFSNSEIGTHVVRVTPFLFRAICLNGCIWGRTDSKLGISKKHLGEINTEELTELIAMQMGTALSEGHNLLNQLQVAREVSIPEAIAPKIISYLSKDHKLTTAESRAWWAGYQVERNEGTDFDTGFGIINGLTRGAHAFKGEQRWGLESVAGAIITPSLTADPNAVIERWRKISERAEDVSDRDVAQLLKVTAG